MSLDPMTDQTTRRRKSGLVIALLSALCLTAFASLELSREGLGTVGKPVPQKTNVVLIVCDTLRADHLGVYGYPRPTSPFLDELARRSVVYENAYSHFSYTWPTVLNLFTGLPFSELVRSGLFTSPSEGFDSGGLIPRNDTLAERLARVGVASAAVSANPYVVAKLGFGQGFEGFHDIDHWNPSFWNGKTPKYTAEAVNQAAFASLASLEAAGKPWLLYLHYYDPHMPYVAPAEDRRLFEDPSYSRTDRVVDGWLMGPDGKYLGYLRKDQKGWLDGSDVAHLTSQYDAEIRRLDRGLAELFAHLKARGLDETTIVILTADHGEAFLERGFWGHGFLSRSEEEHVPLLVVPPPGHPGLRPARIRGVATTTDIYYTLLRHFGALPPEAEDSPWWAVDLLSGRRRHKVAYSEGPQDTVVLRSTDHSYYVYAGFDHPENAYSVQDGEYLFDRRGDPAEERNLFGEAPEVSAAIRERLLAELGLGAKELPKTGGDPFYKGGEETKKRLRALGYLR